MATAVHMDYILPLKQGTSFQMLLQNTGCVKMGYLFSQCNCIRIKFTETWNILEILLLASLY